jgi:tryptophanyl-tRNA synthetase
LERQRLLTGARPTGYLHLGHLLGAFSLFVAKQYEFDAYFIVSDVHMLTTRTEPSFLSRVNELMRGMIADVVGCGVDPARTTFFLQSEVPSIAQLYALLQMFIPARRAQDTPSLQETGIADPSFGLLSYPVMEAADIIASGAHVVPVGRDNVDHLDITRAIATRVNELYGVGLPVPECITGHTNNLIGTDGAAKMSKSLGNAVLLRDDPDAVRARMLDMPWPPLVGRESPVLTYLRAFGDERRYREVEEVVRAGRASEIDPRPEVAELMEALLAPMRRRSREFLEAADINELLSEGTARMREEARAVLLRLKRAMGLPTLPDLATA